MGVVTPVMVGLEVRRTEEERPALEDAVRVLPQYQSAATKSCWLPWMTQARNAQL